MSNKDRIEYIYIIIKKYKHMFWFLFALVILVGCAVAWLAEFFQQMKTSEYEEVRMMYWFLVVAFWVTILIWIIK